MWFVFRVFVSLLNVHSSIKTKHRVKMILSKVRFIVFLYFSWIAARHVALLNKVNLNGLQGSIL